MPGLPSLTASYEPGVVKWLGRTVLATALDMLYQMWMGNFAGLVLC